MKSLTNNSQDIVTIFGQEIAPSETYELQENEYIWLENQSIKDLISTWVLTLYSTVVTPRQMRLALLANSITNQMVEDAIAQLDEPDKSAAQISWEYALEFDLNDPLAAAVGALLGLTEEQMVAIWELAVTL